MKSKLFGLAAVACAAAAFTAAGARDAAAQTTVAIGSLTCGVEGGASFIIGSTRELRCVFSASGNREDGERYIGRIRKFGLDIGVTGRTVLSWAVVAPSREYGPGALAGYYVGAAADASVGLGGGANVLVGGSGNTISLQPLSVQGQKGLNAAVAVASIELHPYEPEPLK